MSLLVFMPVEYAVLIISRLGVACAYIPKQVQGFIQGGGGGGAPWDSPPS